MLETFILYCYSRACQHDIKTSLRRDRGKKRDMTETWIILHVRYVLTVKSFVHKALQNAFSNQTKSHKSIPLLMTKKVHSRGYVTSIAYLKGCNNGSMQLKSTQTTFASQSESITAACGACLDALRAGINKQNLSLTKQSVCSLSCVEHYTTQHNEDNAEDVISDTDWDTMMHDGIFKNYDIW